MRPMTDDLTRGDRVPYFLWDEDVTVDELRAILADRNAKKRDRLLGKMLREARDPDVWRFVTPHDVLEALPRIERRVGRRLPFWRWLLDGWKKDGLL